MLQIDCLVCLIQLKYRTCHIVKVVWANLSYNKSITGKFIVKVVHADLQYNKSDVDKLEKKIKKIKSCHIALDNNA